MKIALPKTSAWRIDTCFVCHKHLTDAVTFPEDGVSFCKTCFHTVPCSSCFLPCGPKHRKLTDGRIICNVCHSIALITPRQLVPMYELTIKFFKRKLKMKLKEHPGLKVVDTRYLQSLGCPPGTWGLYLRKPGEETIYILNGIPSDQSLITLAHELTHYWQRLNCPPRQSLELVEGFATWVAYKLASHKNLERAKLGMRRNIAEPYYTGLRTMLALEQNLKVKGVVKLAKQALSL